ncbi:transcriptional regulator [Micromonospora chalcea]|uniref:Transcriptional regulator n=1 Tax=Micromonospora chalcea TaxID=1874 RepID=A0ABX9Y0J6_MICCH|nr:helix-turn-helix transcriptional regulator [Micromonospora sp. CMU55-4]ODB80404.1 transcriptional regulator [Micromonospora sp. II]RQW88512.1 transcriptional regulator [Micromonospora chalcea]RQX21024.1 transcriptional regulator [Micromonospora chalcea]
MSPSPTRTATGSSCRRPVSEPDVFAALANPTRREVLRLLRDEGEQPVQRLADRFEMRRPSLSEHLRVLKDAGLVTERPVGRQRVYALRPEPLREVADWLTPYERFWRQRLAGLGDVLDAMPDE